MAWKECCLEYWLKELQENMDWDITEILLKMALNTIQSISVTLRKMPSENNVEKGE